MRLVSPTGFRNDRKCGKCSLKCVDMWMVRCVFWTAHLEPKSRQSRPWSVAGACGGVIIGVSCRHLPSDVSIRSTTALLSRSMSRDSWPPKSTVQGGTVHGESTKAQSMAHSTSLSVCQIFKNSFALLQLDRLQLTAVYRTRRGV